MPIFFGKHQKRSYFEGWYFRNQNETEVISLIPAIHIDDKGQKSASIQVIMNTASDNITYPFDYFAVLYVRVTFIDRRRCLIMSNKAQL